MPTPLHIDFGSSHGSLVEWRLATGILQPTESRVFTRRHTGKKVYWRLLTYINYFSFFCNSATTDALPLSWGPRASDSELLERAIQTGSILRLSDHSTFLYSGRIQTVQMSGEGVLLLPCVTSFPVSLRPTTSAPWAVWWLWASARGFYL